MQRHLAHVDALTARSRQAALACALLALAAAPTAWAQGQLPAPPSSPAPVQRLEYDPTGNLTRHVQQTVTAGAGLATQHQYDKLNRLTLTVDARAGLTRRAYSASDDLTALTDPINAQTIYGRDGLGQVVLQSSPDSGNSNHTFNAAGQLVTRTDARGVVSNHTYDALGRLTRLEHAGQGFDTQFFNFNFDEVVNGSTSGIGQLTSISGHGNYAQYSYDAAGRVVQRLQGTYLNPYASRSALVNLLTAYTYDDGGNITSITLPSGRVVIYTRSAGVAQAISVAANAAAAATPVMSQIQWLPFGAPGAWLWHTHAGTSAHNRSFDTNERAVRYTLGTKVRDLRYDEADRIVGYTHYDANSGAAMPALDQQFGYDELNRLTTFISATRTTGIAYDANGNRSAISINGNSGTYSNQAQSNRMLAAPLPPRSYSYDGAGNPGPVGTSDRTEYDAAGRLATIKAGAILSRFFYNALGQRIIKHSQGPNPSNLETNAHSGAHRTPSSLVFVYDQGQHLLGEYDIATGAAVREYVWLEDTPVAMLKPDATNPQGQPRVYLIHTDHLNTPRVLLDQDNTERWRWLDEPFGSGAAEEDPQESGQALEFNLRFPGQYYDAESGLHYNLNRYFDPTTGRYTQSDPIGLAGGINTYSYVENQPTRYTDLLGLETYICRRPLGGAPGSYAPPLLNHTYVCVGSGENMTCGSTTASSGGVASSIFVGSPGKPTSSTTDYFKPEACERRQGEDSCIEICIANELKKPTRPRFGVGPVGTDCREYTEDVVSTCEKRCVRR